MKFTSGLADCILERISEGESLRAICSDKAMPSRQTVLRWLWGDCEEAKEYDFVAKYARAREAQGDAMDDKILEIADSVTSETALADRIRLSAYQWRASKLRPKVYGDKIVQEQTGPEGGPVQHVHKIERQIVRANTSNPNG